MFERIRIIIGDDLEKIKNKRILIIGLGGVGGYTLETLIRSGIQNITIVDGDTIDITNLNRQIISLNDNINSPKVDAWEERIREINKDCNVTKIFKFITKDNLESLFTCKYDYVIDTCDTVPTKVELIKYCLDNNIKVISSMGMGNRLDATKIKLTTLDKTNYDPLAKKLRVLFKQEKINMKVPVVCSEESPIKSDKIGSMAHVVAEAGILITNYIINDILGDKNE